MLGAGPGSYITHAAPARTAPWTIFCEIVLCPSPDSGPFITPNTGIMTPTFRVALEALTQNKCQRDGSSFLPFGAELCRFVGVLFFLLAHECSRTSKSLPSQSRDILGANLEILRRRLEKEVAHIFSTCSEQVRHLHDTLYRGKAPPGIVLSTILHGTIVGEEELAVRSSSRGVSRSVGTVSSGRIRYHHICFSPNPYKYKMAALFLTVSAGADRVTDRARRSASNGDKWGPFCDVDNTG
ncbi:hypothetical protein J6590_006283 [Homalodisca vitripennis]|nr:hypothetical protein J6590_006283 [Homalodisca vitripennis]